jgi:Asp-tRNA(Asn)/Glu-tRNA(Gln) amidotransferase C subunit
MKDQKDKELIEQMEALEEVIDWLEEKSKLDMDDAAENTPVDENEVDEWLRSPKLKKVLKWIDQDQ